MASETFERVRAAGYQGRFADIPMQIKPGDRPPELESKVRATLAAAALGLQDRTKGEALLREAVSLDEKAPAPKIALARQLLNSNAGEAECHSCIKSKNHSKTNPETNSQENAGGESFSKTGDKTQVDLPPEQTSGLVDAMQKLSGVKGIGFVELERSDIVRHRLVQNIVNAYERK